MKNYSSDVVCKLQEAINAKSIDIKNFSNEEEMPRLVYFNGAKVSVIGDTKKDVVVSGDLSFNGDDYKSWKSSSLGKFYVKDLKRCFFKHEEAFKKYVEVEFIVDDLNIIGLLRKITKDELPNIVNEETGEEVNVYDEYNDLTINGEDYCIIKLYVKDLEGYGVKSHFDENTFMEKIMSSYGYVKDEDESEDETVSLKDASEIEDDDAAKSIELF